jgi:hypothetical protein
LIAVLSKGWLLASPCTAQSLDSCRCVVAWHNPHQSLVVACCDNCRHNGKNAVVFMSMVSAVSSAAVCVPLLVSMFMSPVDSPSGKHVPGRGRLPEAAGGGCKELLLLHKQQLAVGVSSVLSVCTQQCVANSAGCNFLLLYFSALVFFW